MGTDDEFASRLAIGAPAFVSPGASWAPCELVDGFESLASEGLPAIGPINPAHLVRCSSLRTSLSCLDNSRAPFSGPS